MENDKIRKELQMQYKDRTITGGVFAVRNAKTNKLLLDATTDLRGSKNRFEFAQKTGSCVDMRLQSDWSKQGAGEFAFEILEELEKTKTQTDAEFAADIKLLKEIWLEKLDGENLY